MVTEGGVLAGGFTVIVIVSDLVSVPSDTLSVTLYGVGLAVVY